MHQRRNGRVRRKVSQIRHRAVHRPVLPGAGRVWRDLRFKGLYRSGKEFELMERAMGFAALAMLTVFPMLVVVAAASAASRHGLARWVVYGMSLTGPSARAVVQLFAAPGRVLGTTSVFSGLLAAVFGVTFAGSVQAGFERIWVSAAVVFGIAFFWWGLHFLAGGRVSYLAAMPMPDPRSPVGDTGRQDIEVRLVDPGPR